MSKSAIIKRKETMKSFKEMSWLFLLLIILAVFAAFTLGGGVR